MGSTIAIPTLCVQILCAGVYQRISDPFCLLYGRDPRLPTETVLSKPVSPYQVDLEDYCCELVTRMSRAWTLARERIEHAQQTQKSQYDRHAKNPELRIGERVMVYKPGEVQGPAWKLAQPYHGPYRIVSLTPNNAEMVLVDQPKEPSIFVSLNHVRRCYEELEDTSWT